MLENKVINFVKTREINDHGEYKKILDLHITGSIISIVDRETVEDVLRELNLKCDLGWTYRECMDYLKWYLIKYHGM